MARSLYLDTARLGRMSPTALRLHNSFVRLAAEEPCSLYSENLLQYGIDAVPEFAERFPELKRWRGIADLKVRLAQSLVGPNATATNVMLAGRTHQLMRMAVRLLFDRCQHIAVASRWRPRES